MNPSKSLALAALLLAAGRSAALATETDNPDIAGINDSTPVYICSERFADYADDLKRYFAQGNAISLVSQLPYARLDDVFPPITPVNPPSTTRLFQDIQPRLNPTVDGKVRTLSRVDAGGNAYTDAAGILWKVQWVDSTVKDRAAPCATGDKRPSCIMALVPHIGDKAVAGFTGVIRQDSSAATRLTRTMDPIFDVAPAPVPPDAFCDFLRKKNSQKYNDIQKKLKLTPP